MAYDVSVFRCSQKNGHALGIVQKNGHGMTRLMLYRHAVDSDAVQPAEVDIIAVIHSAEEIRCDICGEVRTWEPNIVEFERLMKHYNKSLVEEKS